MGPRLAVEAVSELTPAEERSKVTVLDVAAGTGLVGLEVKSYGIKFISHEKMKQIQKGVID